MATHALQTTLVVTALIGALSAQNLVRTTTGLQAGGKYGSSLANVGDVNRDGSPDWIVGAPLNSYLPLVANRGIAIVHSGKDGRWLHNVTGQRAGMRLGTTVAGVGDVNGDGHPDFAVGAPSDTAGGGSNAGYAAVHSGKDGSVLWSKLGETNSKFGTAICGIGDVDRDGYTDVAVGAPENSSLRPFGIVYLYSGRTGTQIRMITGRTDFTGFGHALANAGDIDGDGRDDLAVGEPRAADGGFNNGRIWLFSTRTTSMTVIWTHDGIASAARLGTSLAGGKDVNGDGIPDLIAGGPGLGTTQCIAPVLNGRTGALIRQHQNPMGTGFGLAVAMLGDVNGDGRPDYAVGAPLENAGAGSTRIYSGATGALLFERKGVAGDQSGAAVCGTGDLTGDGLGDVAIGLPLADDHSADAGKVELRSCIVAGKAVAFGKGCRTAAGAPNLTGAGTLRIGGNMALAVAGAAPFAGGTLVLSNSNTSWAGLNLPIDLAPVGMAGCQVYVAITITSGLATNAAGAYSLSIPLPNEAWLVAQTMYAQTWLTDGVNAAGLVTSNGLAITIGN